MKFSKPVYLNSTVNQVYSIKKNSESKFLLKNNLKKILQMAYIYFIIFKRKKYV